MGAAILDYGGGHVCQLPRQRVCELNIGVLGGGVFLLCVYNENDNNDGTMTQISRSHSL